MSLVRGLQAGVGVARQLGNIYEGRKAGIRRQEAHEYEQATQISPEQVAEMRELDLEAKRTANDFKRTQSKQAKQKAFFSTMHSVGEMARMDGSRAAKWLNESDMFTNGQTIERVGWEDDGKGGQVLRAYEKGGQTPIFEADSTQWGRVQQLAGYGPKATNKSAKERLVERVMAETGQNFTKALHTVNSSGKRFASGGGGGSGGKTSSQYGDMKAKDFRAEQRNLANTLMEQDLTGELEFKDAYRQAGETLRGTAAAVPGATGSPQASATPQSNGLMNMFPAANASELGAISQMSPEQQAELQRRAQREQRGIPNPTPVSPLSLIAQDVKSGVGNWLSGDYKETETLPALDDETAGPVGRDERGQVNRFGPLRRQGGRGGDRMVSSDAESAGGEGPLTGLRGAALTDAINNLTPPGNKLDGSTPGNRSQAVLKTLEPINSNMAEIARDPQRRAAAKKKLQAIVNNSKGLNPDVLQAVKTSLEILKIE